MNNIYEEITIRGIKSFSGYSFVFDSKEVYDRYTLYEKLNNETLLVETVEDFIYNSTVLQEGHIYYVEAYKKEGENFLLKARSKDYTFTLIPKRKEFLSPLVSIIVPVYNSKGYLERCIDSVLLSTFDNYELILVNDGSTDSSPDVIEWYQKEYEGIRVYHQENKGVSFARNKGIELACGDYICFLDNDDIVHPRMYEELYQAIEDTNSPIAIGKTIIKEVDQEPKVILEVPRIANEKNIAISYDEMIKRKHANGYENIYFVAIWNKMIRSDLVKEHLFPANNYYEDTAHTRMIYSYIDQFSFAFDAYYIWDKRRQAKEGTSTTINYHSRPDDKYEMHKYYFESQLYGINTGREDRKAIMIVDALVDIYDYMKKVNSLDPENELFQILASIVHDTVGDYPILEIEYFNEKPEVKRFAEDIVNSWK